MNSLMEMDVKVTGQKRIKALLSLLSMSDEKRQAILRKIARKAKSASNDHRRKQSDLQGKKWEGRKKGNKKMFTKWGKHLRATANSEEAKLLFNNTMVARLAYAHEKGIGDNFDIESGENKQDSINQVANKTAGARSSYEVSRQTTQPASKTQAKRLVDSGLFRVKKRRTKNGKTVNGGKGRIPSMKWVRENLTRGQAGMLIRKLGISKGTKKRWYIPRPKRPWLGLTFEETKQMADFIIDEMAQQI